MILLILVKPSADTSAVEHIKDILWLLQCVKHYFYYGAVRKERRFLDPLPH